MADQPSKNTKRRVKNPETFRERAIKAAEAGDKPKRTTRLKTVGGRVTRPVTSPVSKATRKIAGFTVFRWLRKPLRFIGRILLPKYFRDSWKELRQVTWPNWKKSRQLTYAVLVFAVIFGAAVALLDWGLDKVFQDILLK